ncbi:MAG: hypothetical protein ACHQET_04590 [Chitinophagales bacterium]
MKKSIQVCLGIVTAIVFLALACAKTNEDALQRDHNGGDTTTCSIADSVYYNTDITNILNAYCYGCHGSNSYIGISGVLLEGYANLEFYAANGILYGVVNHTNNFPAMPAGQPKLPDCEVNKINKWIAQGHLPNTAH